MWYCLAIQYIHKTYSDQIRVVSISVWYVCFSWSHSPEPVLAGSNYLTHTQVNRHILELHWISKTFLQYQLNPYSMVVLYRYSCQDDFLLRFISYSHCCLNSLACDISFTLMQASFYLSLQILPNILDLDQVLVFLKPFVSTTMKLFNFM
jgi:hypothetical protein